MNTKTSKTSLLLGMALLGAGCATVTPVELTTARTSYARASSGPAVQLLPADLHKAKIVLDAAETSFADEKGSQKTIDLAYIADRTIQTVEAQARTVLADTDGHQGQAGLSGQAGGGREEDPGHAGQDPSAAHRRAARRRRKQAEQLGVEHAARAGGRHQGRRLRAAGAGLRAEDHRSERRAGQAGGQGRGARHGHHPLGRRPVPLQRRQLLPAAQTSSMRWRSPSSRMDGR